MLTQRLRQPIATLHEILKHKFVNIEAIQGTDPPILYQANHPYLPARPFDDNILFGVGDRRAVDEEHI